MRGTRWIITTLAIASIAAPAQASAITLVTPGGQPVGGQWQQWADNAQVPTGPITLPFSTDPATIKSRCLAEPYVAYTACTEVWTASSDGGPTHLSSIFVGVLPPSAVEHYFPTPLAQRANLYKELGQVFDATMLTDVDRQAFIDLFPRATATHQCSYCTTMQARWQYRPTGQLDMSSYAEWFGQGWEDCAAFGSRITQRIVRSPMFSASDGFPVQWMEADRYPVTANATFRVNHKRQAFARHQLAQVCALINRAAAHGPTLVPDGSSLSQSQQ